MLKWLIVFYIFIGISTAASSQDSCDSIYENPEVSAHFNSSDHAKKFIDKITNILLESISEQEVISKISIKLTINSMEKLLI